MQVAKIACEFEPYDLGVICGGVRCFKTLHLVRLMLQAHEMGYQVYTNVRLKFDNSQVRYGLLDSKDSKSCLNQLYEVFDYIEANDLQRIPKFLGLDEFSDLVDSQEWKKATWTTNIWKQLGKMGFTSYVTNQAFSMTYNRYKENTNKKVITRRIDDNFYLVYIGLQSANDHEQYKLVKAYVVDARDAFGRYDTYQRMYSGGKK